MHTHKAGTVSHLQEQIHARAQKILEGHEKLKMLLLFGRTTESQVRRGTEVKLAFSVIEIVCLCIRRMYLCIIFVRNINF